mmetsp:Transcript_10287/g.23303  ORF Transcript_10287/g.23303 Transcript_10287/m.23303 type:complete len:213 (-) Transcript_10287:438-1076(-)
MPRQSHESPRQLLRSGVTAFTVAILYAGKRRNMRPLSPSPGRPQSPLRPKLQEPLPSLATIRRVLPTSAPALGPRPKLFVASQRWIAFLQLLQWCGCLLRSIRIQFPRHALATRAQDPDELLGKTRLPKPMLEEGDRSTIAPVSACTANPVHIGLDLIGEVKYNHMSDMRYVHTTTQHISRHQQRRSPFSEGMQSRLSLFLCFLSMHDATAL